jgi:hypothetical protein
LQLATHLLGVPGQTNCPSGHRQLPLTQVKGEAQGGLVPHAHAPAMHESAAVAEQAVQAAPPVAPQLSAVGGL